jgi:hypothetical protein
LGQHIAGWHAYWNLDETEGDIAHNNLWILCYQPREISVYRAGFMLFEINRPVRVPEGRRESQVAAKHLGSQNVVNAGLAINYVS